MKKAIALFSTLLIMTLVMALITVSIEYITKIHTILRSDRDLIQHNLTFIDMKNFLDTKIQPRVSGLLNDSKAYNDTMVKLILSPISIVNPVNNNIITIKLTSNNGKINFNTFLNWLNNKLVSDDGKDGVNADALKKQFAIDLLTSEDFLMSDYQLFVDIFKANLGNPLSQSNSKNQNSSLKEQVKKENDTLKDLANATDDESTTGNYDLKNYDLYYTKQPQITSWQQFYQIYDVYLAFSQNKERKHIQWERYFYFDDPQKTKLDLNYMDKILIDAIPTQILSTNAKSSIKEHKKIYNSAEGLGISDSDKKKLETLNLTFTSTDFNCEINIKSSSKEIKYSFKYSMDLVGQEQNSNKQTRITFSK